MRRDMKILRLGSIAEASLELSGIFDATQKAADLYFEAARAQADELVRDAQKEAQQILQEAEEKAGQLLREAEYRAQYRSVVQSGYEE